MGNKCEYENKPIGKTFLCSELVLMHAIQETPMQHCKENIHCRSECFSVFIEIHGGLCRPQEEHACHPQFSKFLDGIIELKSSIRVIKDKQKFNFFC